MVCELSKEKRVGFLILILNFFSGPWELRHIYNEKNYGFGCYNYEGLYLEWLMISVE